MPRSIVRRSSKKEDEEGAGEEGLDDEKYQEAVEFVMERGEGLHQYDPEDDSE